MVHITDNVLHLNHNMSADYENKQQLEVTLRAEDPGGLYTEQFFTIDVLNNPSDDPPPPNETPTSISLDNFTIKESVHHFVNDGLMAIFFLVIGFFIIWYIKN